MLLNVLGKLVGSKSLEIKVVFYLAKTLRSSNVLQVDNMSAYNFHPKELLKEVKSSPNETTVFTSP